MRARPGQLAQHLTEVENRIDELAALRHRLQRALRHAEGAPRAKSCRCRIIESASSERQVEIGRPGRSRRSRR